MASTSLAAERLRSEAQELAGVEGLQHEVVRTASAAADMRFSVRASDDAVRLVRRQLLC